MENTAKIYCGSGKTRSGQYGEFYWISICLDDIPEDHITKASNGKRYANLTVSKKKETDKFGKDLSVVVDTWKPDGSKSSSPQAMQSAPQQAPPQEPEGDLPF